MNRHICRAKDINTSEWVYGYYVAVPEEYDHGELVHAIFDPNESEHICMGEYKDYGWHEVDPNTVCRYAGVEDKNGKPLFEHDIVKMRGYSKGYLETEIYFKDGKFAVDGSNYSYKDIRPRSVEFVRSKFDNTELMED